MSYSYWRPWFMTADGDIRDKWRLARILALLGREPVTDLGEGEG